MIDWIMDTSKGDQAIWESVNHTTINSVGLEVSAGLDFRQLLPSQSMLKSLKLSYSYIDQDKKQEPNIVSQYALEYLRHKLIGNLRLQLAKRLELGMVVRWQDRVGSYTDFDGNVCDYRPYCLTDASTRLQTLRRGHQHLQHQLPRLRLGGAARPLAHCRPQPAHLNNKQKGSHRALLL